METEEKGGGKDRRCRLVIYHYDSFTAGISFCSFLIKEKRSGYLFGMHVAMQSSKLALDAVFVGLQDVPVQALR